MLTDHHPPPPLHIDDSVLSRQEVGIYRTFDHLDSKPSADPLVVGQGIMMWHSVQRTLQRYKELKILLLF